MTESHFENVRAQLDIDSENSQNAKNILGGVALLLAEARELLMQIHSPQVDMAQSVTMLGDALNDIDTATRQVGVHDQVVGAYRHRLDAIDEATAEEYRRQAREAAAKLRREGMLTDVDNEVAKGGARVVARTNDGNLIKVPLNSNNAYMVNNLNDSSQALDRVHQQPGFEQKVYSGNEKGAEFLVVKPAPGKGYGDLTDEEKENISPEAFEALAASYATAANANTSIDHSPDNYRYDPKEGRFTLIDISTQKNSQIPVPDQIEAAVIDAAEQVVARGMEAGNALPASAMRFANAVGKVYGAGLQEKVIKRWQANKYNLPT